MELITAQIALDPDQLQALTEESQRRKVSADEIISRILSRSLDDYLVRPKKRQGDPMSLIGLGEDEVEEVSERHDVYPGAFYAMANRRDRHHAAARAYFLSNFGSCDFVTSNLVFVESWLLIQHRLGATASRESWKSIRSNVVAVLEISAQDLELAWTISEQYGDQDFSLIDCASFAIMERLEITRAFAFDSHFTLYRPAKTRFLSGSHEVVAAKLATPPLPANGLDSNSLTLIP